MSLPAERVAALNAAKLKHLVRGRVGDDVAPAALPGGAVVADAEVAWVLLGPDAHHSLGAALAVARRAGAADLQVVVDDAAAAGRLARLASHFAAPPAVWRVEGGDLVPVAATPAPVPAPPPVAPDLRALLQEAGLEVVDGDGVTLGELLGLEVARIVDGPDGPTLEVGVGRFDRELSEMTQAHLAHGDRLHRVVELVAEHRRPGAPPHPLNQLVPERWLRASLVADPSPVAAASLSPVPSVDGRTNLKDIGVATAVGRDTAGEALVVTASTGVALDLVPAAADDRAARAPGARLVLAVPARDALPLTRDLAAALARPAEVVALEQDLRIPWSDG